MPETRSSSGAGNSTRGTTGGATAAEQHSHPERSEVNKGQEVVKVEGTGLDGAVQDLGAQASTCARTLPCDFARESQFFKEEELKHNVPEPWPVCLLSLTSACLRQLHG